MCSSDLGGASIMAAGDQFYNGGLSFNATSGLSVSKLGGGQLAIVPGGLVRNVGDAVIGYKWVVVEKKDRKGKLIKTKALKSDWSVKGRADAKALVVAGNQIVTGGAGSVQVVDKNNR